jgi:hypothetical protein
VLTTGGRVITSRTRTLTRLHLAHLRVAIKGNRTVVSQGRCQPGEYYGPPITTPPTNGSAGSISGGTALTGEICPLNGNAAGLPTGTIAQTDEFSGGLTTIEVPLIVSVSPSQDENVSGAFTAHARAGLPGPNNTIIPNNARISLRITRDHRTVFTARNVNKKDGKKVSGLRPGTYIAVWKLIDHNGDTRTMVTRFIQQR